LWLAVRALLVVAVLVGCGGSNEDAAPPCAGSTVDGTCVAPLIACKNDEIVRDAKCVRVGITSCAAGFIADPDEGCTPVLPAAPCAEGEVAWLGETTCHAVAECTADRYGSPPTTAPILHVDVLGDDANDGSRDKPFKTINAALTRARGTKHTIAIADGTYDEQLVINSDVALWGHCPSKVTLAPTTATQVYAITIVNAAASIKRLGIAGAAGGIVALDTVQATVEDVWIHDTGDAALGAQGDRAEGSLLAKHVLVERARDFGVYALGGTVTVEASVVRGTRSAPGNLVVTESAPRTVSRARRRGPSWCAARSSRRTARPTCSRSDRARRSRARSSAMRSLPNREGSGCGSPRM